MKCEILRIFIYATVTKDIPTQSCYGNVFASNSSNNNNNSRHSDRWMIISVQKDCKEQLVC